MWTVVLVGISAVFFAYLAKFENTKNGLKISFSLIFLFLALRYDFGNDYPHYREMFNDLNAFGLQKYLELQLKEEGWAYLSFLFLPVGFFGFVAFLALFNCLVYYNFIKKYVPTNFYWLAVFIYVFDPYLMLIQASAMRQSLAISLVILSFDFIKTKRYLPFSLLILAASFFHASSLIALVLIPLRIFSWKINFKFGIIFSLFFIALFSAGHLIESSATNLLQSYFNRYEHHLENDIVLDKGIGVGIGLQFILLLITLYFARFQKEDSTLLFKMYLISFLFIPLSLYLWLIDRVGYYFTIFSIVVIPLIAANKSNKLIAKTVPFIVVPLTLYNFFIFFQSEIWIDNFGTYNTVIHHLDFLKN